MFFKSIKRFLNINLTILKGFINFYIQYLEKDYKTDKELSKNDINDLISDIIPSPFVDKLKKLQDDVNPLKIARYGIEMSLKMIYRDRFFHADPHPGNILLLDNGEKIGILDCGMVGIIQEDIKKVADTMLNACGGVNIISKNSYSDYLNDIKVIFHKFVGKKLSGIYRILKKYKIKIAPNYTMIFVAMITIEGVAKTLAPNIDLISEARVFAFDMMSYLE